ncbi:MerR family transcriptional regulator [Paenibacillus sp. FJAT-26967]|uniref:MerR family transcriptional regulator n=1 Tax=Paenibacillus sp. FJAT-26967 TaxID=1729690 RepID=UPI0008388D9D|nr:MerR family transcriptional regulator [Paenibacillus sp. FJAT-26967]
MKISQLADYTGASIRSIRHYESKGLLQVSRLANNYREFDESSVKSVRTIQMYLGLGLTIDQIRDIMYCKYPEIQETDENKGIYCEELLQVYEKKRMEIIEQRKTLDEAQQKLEMQINLLRRNRENLKN